MAIFKSALDSARAEVKKLRLVRATLEEKHQAAIAELAQLREQLPELALTAALGDEPTPPEGQIPYLFRGASGVRNKMLMLQSDIEQCTAAMSALFPRLDAALRDVQHARAENVRTKAARFKKSLDEHRTKAQELQSALQILEECPWAPEVRQVASDSGQVGWQYAISLSTRLQNQLDAMLAEADAIAAKPVNRGGGVNASTLEELLTQLEQADDTTIAPTPRAVEAWYRAARAQADAEWNGTGRRHGDPEPPAAELSDLESYRTLSIGLVWLKDGAIDAQNSSVRYSNRFTIPRELAAEHGAEYARTVSED